MKLATQRPLRVRWIVSLVVFTIGFCSNHGQAQNAALQKPVLLAISSRNTNANYMVESSAPVNIAAWREELKGLQNTNSPAAATQVSEWLTRLLEGKAAREIQLELLETAKKFSAPAVQEKLDRFQSIRLDQGGMANYSELLYGGSVESGKKIFFSKPEANCVKCHKVGTEGGATGPDLSHVGTRLTREVLLESMLLPDAKITEGYAPVVVILNDRNAYRGTLKQETASQLAIETEEDGIATTVTVDKANIATRKKGTSPMPEGIGQLLSSRDLRDLVEFLASLH